MCVCRWITEPEMPDPTAQYCSCSISIVRRPQTTSTLAVRGKGRPQSLPPTSPPALYLPSYTHSRAGAQTWPGPIYHECFGDQHTVTALFHVTSHCGLELKHLDDSVNILLAPGTSPEDIQSIKHKRSDTGWFVGRAKPPPAFSLQLSEAWKKVDFWFYNI